MESHGIEADELNGESISHPFQERRNLKCVAQQNLGEPTAAIEPYRTGKQLACVSPVEVLAQAKQCRSERWKAAREQNIKDAEVNAAMSKAEDELPPFKACCADLPNSFWK